MYQAPLNHFKETKKYFHKNEFFVNAQSFSDRIITFPLHKYVTEKDIEAIRTVMEKFFNQHKVN